jgi:hypothetical protein
MLACACSPPPLHGYAIAQRIAALEPGAGKGLALSALEAAARGWVKATPHCRHGRAVRGTPADRERAPPARVTANYAASPTPSPPCSNGRGFRRWALVGEWGRSAWFLVNRRRHEGRLRQEMESHRAMMDDGRRFRTPPAA